MLACACRRVYSVLPRPLAFSTTPPRQEDAPKVVEPYMGSLITMLDKEAETVSPIIPEMNQIDQSV